MAIHCYIFSFNKFQWKRRNIIISPLLSHHHHHQTPSLPMTSLPGLPFRTHQLGMLILTPMCSGSSIIPGRTQFVNDNLTVGNFICVIRGKR
ncbi:hypothetical protein Peur_065200 [Populus x canadensis]